MQFTGTKSEILYYYEAQLELIEESTGKYKLTFTWHMLLAPLLAHMSHMKHPSLFSTWFL